MNASLPAAASEVIPVIYLGDEVTAAGYRLAGVHAVVARPGAEAEALDQAFAKASIVLISTAVAIRIPEQRLRAMQAALSPLVVVVPDLLNAIAVPDIAGRLRTQLGLEA